MSNQPDQPSRNVSDDLEYAGHIRRFAVVLLALTFIAALSLLLVRLDDPLLEYHSFRQTQTAISVWNMLHGGPAIDYLTPVAGAPWTMPFEAPVYNLVVASLHALTPLDLDAAGRVASFMFLVGTVGFGAAVIGELMVRGRLAQLMFASLMFASPQYLFWGQAFLMETCATFFGTAMLYGVVLYSRRPAIWTLALLLIAAVLCALAKTTTWFVFAIACGMHWTGLAIVRRRIDWSVTAALVAVATISGAGAVAWTAHADGLKAGGLFTSELTQAKLLSFHLGGVSIRFSADFWANILPFRMLPDALGLAWPAIPFGLFWAWRHSRTTFFLASGALLTFFLPLIIVMNAHAVHNYYQTANAVMAIAAAAMIAGALVQTGKPVVASGLIAVLVLGQLVHFGISHAPLIAQPHDRQPTYLAAKGARAMTDPAQSLFVFGVDQSSEIHYYAERRGVAFTDTFPIDKVGLALNSPQVALADHPLGGVVDCRGFGRKSYAPAFDAMVTRFVARARGLDGAQSRRLPGGCEIIAFPKFE